MQRFAVLGATKRNSNPSEKDNPIYVGMESHLDRMDEEKNQKEKKKGDVDTGIEKEKQNKKIRNIEDGLLLVISTRIHGKSV